jgi:hypothetical protein
LSLASVLCQIVGDEFFINLHIFLEVGKTQNLSCKIWQTLGDSLMTCFLHIFNVTYFLCPSFIQRDSKEISSTRHYASSKGRHAEVRMEMDRIRLETDSYSIFYHILLAYKYRFECSRIRIQNRCLEFGNAFRYLLDLEDNVYQFSLLIIYNYKTCKD